MRNLIILLTVILFAMCKRDTSPGNYSNLSAIKIKASIGSLSGVLENPTDGNLLVNVTNYYSTENVIRLLLVNPVTHNIITEDSTKNAYTGSICTSGNNYYVAHGQQFSHDSIPLLLTRYDENLKKIKSVDMGSLFAVNFLNTSTLTLKDGSVLCIVGSTKNYMYYTFFHFDKELNLIKRVQSGNPGNKYNQPSVNAIKELSDGSFLLAITNTDSANNYSLRIEKRDKDFNFLWSKSVHENGYLYPSKLLIETNGSFWVVGSFLSNTSTSLEYDPIAYKFDKDANIIHKHYVPTQATEMRGNSAVLTSDGGIMFTVLSNEGKGANNSTVITKLNSNAELVWRKKYGGAKNTAGNPFLMTQMPRRHLLAYLDNSFFNSPEGYNLILNYIDDDGL